ncbi:histidine phosphatase family protein [Candidatus Poriferisodalis sp.]|uniref:histidine phosphatase family protein n=1 Tax=Candidatus Poriferisodalis sp. TaxID=3101277 RepID=UPI003B02BE08
MLILARHGRTQANASHLLQGRSDNRLDEVGERQAADIAAALAQLDGGLDRIISSPLPRAMQTAAASAELVGIEVMIDERWSELDYGEWEARPISEVGAEAWRHWRSDASFTPPGGESLAELNIRVAQACEAAAAEASEMNIAVFTHVSPIKAAVRWVLDVDDEISWHLHVAQAQITKIEVRGERVLLNAFNDVSHLGSV